MIEQAFVSCSLGAQMVTGTLVAMGLMQFIVSCTLSMLLRHVKRYAVLGKCKIIKIIVDKVRKNTVDK